MLSYPATFRMELSPRGWWIDVSCNDDGCLSQKYTHSHGFIGVYSVRDRDQIVPDLLAHILRFHTPASDAQGDYTCPVSLVKEMPGDPFEEMDQSGRGVVW